MSLPSTFSSQRVIRGNVETAAYPAASGYQINAGDMCVFFSGNLYPVSAYGGVIAWNSGNEIQNWSGARATFAGVALGQNNSYSYTSGSVTTALGGVAEYPYPAVSGATLMPGTFVGFTQDQTSGYFNPQEMMQCSGASTAIGKIVEPEYAYISGAGYQSGLTFGPGTNTIKVEFQSFLVFGGVAN